MYENEAFEINQIESFIENLSEKLYLSLSVLFNRVTGLNKEIQSDLEALGSEKPKKYEEKLEKIENLFRNQQFFAEFEKFYYDPKLVSQFHPFFSPYQVKYYLLRLPEIKQKKYLKMDFLNCYYRSTGPSSFDVNGIKIVDFTKPRNTRKYFYHFFDTKIVCYVLNLSQFFKFIEFDEKINLLKEEIENLNEICVHKIFSGIPITVLFSNFREFKKDVKKRPDLLDPILSSLDIALEEKKKPPKEIVSTIFQNFLSKFDINREINYFVLDLLDPSQVFHCFQQTIDPIFKLEQPHHLDSLVEQFCVLRRWSIDTNRFFSKSFHLRLFCFLCVLKHLEKKQKITKIPKFVVFEIFKIL